MPEIRPSRLVLSHSSTFQQGLALQLRVYISRSSTLSTMDYQSSSRSQKKRSPTGSDTASSSSRQALSTTSAPPSLRYFTAAASSSTPYESPYAQDQDRRSQPPSDSSVRSTSRSTSLYPSLSGNSTTRASHSKQSSSSGDSIYDSPGPRGSRNTTPGGTMSTQRTMSSVSVSLEDFFLLPGRFLRFTTSCGVFTGTRNCFECDVFAQ